MKRFFLFQLMILLAVFAALTSCKKAESTLVTKYVIRRVTTSGVCQVWDAQASPVGVIVGGGPFASKAEATTRMCELRTNDIADATKCFEVNPINACPTPTPLPQADLDLPDSAVAYLDSLPSVKVDISQALLPNGMKLGEYEKKLLARSKLEGNRAFVFRADTPQEQLSQLFVQFFKVAGDLVDDSKHPIAKGADDTEPKQDGLAYNYGSKIIKNDKDEDVRRKMNAASCKLKVVGLDCSGLLFQVFSQSNCKGMNLTALEQSNPTNLDAAIAGVVTGVKAKDKGKLASALLITGDIVYWDKIGDSSASHIGIVLKSGSSLFVYQSNGGAGECEGNLTPKRGPNVIPINDAFWFGATCNWKVLRYQVT